jgi:hypothetical protein
MMGVMADFRALSETMVRWAAGLRQLSKSVPRMGGIRRAINS